MLTQLTIKNFTLIESLDIDFRPGFSVITGETGAGKSIILGAISLLLGGRADSKSIKHGAHKCTIEAHFDLSRYSMKSFFDANDIEYDANDCIIRRELMATGKSRAFINDTPVPLAMLKELGSQLVDVHSQHQNLLLDKQDFQLSVVDTIAEDQDLLADYKVSFNEFCNVRKQLKELEDTIEMNRDNAELMQFLFDELDNAQLKAGEQETLEQRAEMMSHSEDIKTALYEIDNALTAENMGAVNQLYSASHTFAKITTLLPDTRELAERLESSYIEVEDIANEIKSKLDEVDYDPSELERTNARLDKIYDLEKKHRADSVEKLIAIRNELNAKLRAVENSDEALADMSQALNEAKSISQVKAEKLSKKRKVAAKTIENGMQAMLIPLGMPNVRFTIIIKGCELSATGIDNVEFLFSANKNMPLQPVAQVASGGEIARVMLSLKAMISGKVKLPTIIFDEIDTGVSGKIAEQMAKMMKSMGEQNRQVISITHLPQIAAMGATHYKVEKSDEGETTISRMRLLTGEERIHEIAQMLSGSSISEAAINNARELLRGEK